MGNALIDTVYNHQGAASNKPKFTDRQLAIICSMNDYLSFFCRGNDAQDPSIQQKRADVLFDKCASAEFLINGDLYKFVVNLTRFRKLSEREFNTMTDLQHLPNREDYHISEQLTNE